MPLCTNVINLVTENERKVYSLAGIGNSRLIKCKSVLRGDSDGDKLVAMIVLNKAGVKVSRPIMEKIRSENAGTDEEKMRAAVDVYDVIQSFIQTERRGSVRDTMNAFNAVVDRYNKYEGVQVCTNSERETHWEFFIHRDGIEPQKYVYNKNRFNLSAADGLFDFFARNSTACDSLYRIYSAMEEYDH